LKKGIRKILTGTSVPLDTCLLMGDPPPERGTATFACMTGLDRLHINVQSCTIGLIKADPYEKFIIY
jgi:hypothetical protein